MEKKEFRKSQIKRLSKFVHSNQAKKEFNQLYQKLFESEIFTEAQSIGVTISSDIEMPTDPIIKMAFKTNKDVYIPKTYTDKSMSFIKFEDYGALKKTKFGILEPIEDINNLNPPDLLIIPGLAFSKKEHARLGFGAGYYDRYIQSYPTNMVALANSVQLFENAEWDIEKFDKRIDNIFTFEN